MKDETGGRHGNVNVEPGTGDVDFPAVFATLCDTGFSAGPVTVECLGGTDLQDVNARAARVRERVEAWVSRSNVQRH